MLHAIGYGILGGIIVGLANAGFYYLCDIFFDTTTNNSPAEIVMAACVGFLLGFLAVFLINL